MSVTNFHMVQEKYTHTCAQMKGIREFTVLNTATFLKVWNYSKYKYGNPLWHLQNLNQSEKVSWLFSFSLFYFMKLYANGTREVRERLQIHPSSMTVYWTYDVTPFTIKIGLLNHGIVNQHFWGLILSKLYNSFLWVFTKNNETYVFTEMLPIFNTDWVYQKMITQRSLGN